MTTQSSQGPNSGRIQFVDGLNSAIRENPVAAGLVGLGVLWMFFGNAKVSALADGITGTTSDALSAAFRGVKDTTRSVGETAEDYAGEVVHKASETVRQVGESVEKRAELVAETTRASGQGAGSASNHRHAGKAVQQNLSLTIERQPLMLGVIGLGIGAGIASMFSATELERDLMGETGAVAKEKINDILSEAAELGEKIVNEVKKEAATQGVTAQAAETSAKAVVEKVKTVAAAGKQSVFKASPDANLAPNS